MTYPQNPDWKTGAVKRLFTDDQEKRNAKEYDVEQVARLLCINDPNVKQSPDDVSYADGCQTVAWHEYVDSAIAVISYITGER